MTKFHKFPEEGDKKQIMWGWESECYRQISNWKMEDNWALRENNFQSQILFPNYTR